MLRTASTSLLLVLGAALAACSGPQGPPLPSGIVGPNAGMNCPSGTIVRGAAPPKGRKVYCVEVGKKGRKARIGPVVSWACSRCKDGASLHGEYILGIRDGIWTLVSRDGKKIEQGRFHHGVVSGEWTGWHPNGTERWRKSYDKKGRKHGLAWKKRANGTREYEGYWERNIKQGKWATWRADGTREAEGKHDRGEREGEWRFYDKAGNYAHSAWYDGGKKVKIGELKDGVLRISSVDSKGRKTGTWSEQGGKRHGIVVEYWPGTETPKRKTNYTMGVKTGSISLHRPDGSKMASGELLEGRKQCGWRLFDKAGKELTRGYALAALLARHARNANIAIPADPCAWTLDNAVTLRRGGDVPLSIAIARWLIENILDRRVGEKLQTEPLGNADRYEAAVNLLKIADAEMAKFGYETAALIHLAVMVEIDRANGGTILNLPPTATMPGSPQWRGPAVDKETAAKFKALGKAQLPKITQMLTDRENGEQAVRKAGRITLGKMGLNKLTLGPFRKRFQ